MKPKDYAERMAVAYAECAVWAGLDNDRDPDCPPPLDENYSTDDLAPETWERIGQECRDFCDACWDDLQAVDPEQAGHDFHLTRNRHGAGFWDRGLGDVGERLTAAAHAYGEDYLYAGDDGQLYLD